MKIWHDLQQQSEEWFAVRAGRPTASQFSRILTPTGKDSSQWDGYAIELAAECVRPDYIGFTGSFHTDRGNELEPLAREEFARIMGVEVATVGFITRDDTVVGCSPDSLVVSEAGKYVAGLEIKCPAPKKHAADLIAGELPAEHRPQVHGGMAVTGLNHWYYMSYCQGFAPLIVRVDRDEYTARLSDALDRFLIYYANRRKEIMPMLLGKEAA